MAARRVAPLALACLVAGGAAGLAALSGRAPTLAVAALPAHLSTRLGAPVDQVEIVAGGPAAWGMGEPVQLWVTAALGERTALLHGAGRRRGDHLAVTRAPRPLVDSALADARLLAARADAALVAMRRGDRAASALVVFADGRRQGDGQAAPARALSGTLTADSARIVADGAPITVNLATGATTGGAASRAPHPPAPARMIGVGAAPASTSPPDPVDGWPAWQAITPGWRVEAPGGVHLWALDSREIELRYVPGRLLPGAPHGKPGLGAHPGEALGWIAAAAPGGASAAGQAYAPLLRGGAALRLTPDGLGRLGAFAGEPMAPKTGALRQGGPALVLDGRPVQVESDVSTQRAGLGVTEAGWLVVGWSADSTRHALAETLARVGVRQAIESGPEGMAIGEAPLAPGMATAWGSPHRGERYAIVRRSGLDGAALLARGWRPIAKGRLAIRRRGSVELTLIDPAGVRGAIVPGAAELGGALPDPADGWLLTGGVRSPRAPYGLKLGSTVRRALRESAMGLRIDGDGRISLGAVGREVAAELSVLQGPGLIRDGRKAVDPARVDPGPLAAIAQRSDGRLVYAATTAGPDALVDALLDAGAVDAIRLGDRGTVDAGQVIHAGRTAFGDRGAPAPRAGTAIHLTPVPRPPSLRPTAAVRAR